MILVLCSHSLLRLAREDRARMIEFVARLTEQQQAEKRRRAEKRAATALPA